MQESGKAAVFLNECADSGNQNCNHASFKHPCGTGAHIAKQIGWRNHVGCNHDNRAADDTDNQHKEHIQSHDAANQYQNIVNCLNQLISFINKAAIIAFYRKNKNNDYADNRRRQGDKEIFLKFICHFTALPVAGSDGCIRNKGQVIPEHCTAHDRSNAKRHEKPDAFATAMPMGTISVIVPTEVPMASDTRQLTMKSTATANCGGIRERMK